ncbi:hypothetical protein TYRP_011144 [Tyrophagus putrescentiae]|nr:hypothetical protein TYRP_011144 [Tyrophagus putrescentiae]
MAEGLVKVSMLQSQCSSLSSTTTIFLLSIIFGQISDTASVPPRTLAGDPLESPHLPLLFLTLHHLLHWLIPFSHHHEDARNQALDALIERAM